MRARIQLRESSLSRLPSRKRTFLKWMERVLFLCGGVAVGYCLIVYFEARLYQAYENRRLDQEIREQAIRDRASSDPTIDRTQAAAPGPQIPESQLPQISEALPPVLETNSADLPSGIPQRLPQIAAPRVPSARASVNPRAQGQGSLIGRLDIPRVGISTVVVEGIGSKDLRHAVGHVPGTALPGQTGNVAIAGHRDTFFRGLREIRAGDTITLTTPRGTYSYGVDSAVVVDPHSVYLLKASSSPELTLITCYPFYYVGPAPDRFVVRARAIANN
jgi:sortase A